MTRRFIRMCKKVQPTSLPQTAAHPRTLAATHPLSQVLELLRGPAMVSGVLLWMAQVSGCTLNLNPDADEYQVPSPTVAPTDPDDPTDPTPVPVPLDEEVTIQGLDLEAEPYLVDFGEVPIQALDQAELSITQSNDQDYTLGVTVLIEAGQSVFGVDGQEDSWAGGLESGREETVSLSFRAPVVGLYEGRARVLVPDSATGYLDILLTAVAIYRDRDEDGYPEDIDCNDGNGNVFPGAEEICNGQDDDCDGEVDEGVMTTWFQDRDHDGYGNPAVPRDACSRPDGYTTHAEDCDDENAQAHPGAGEVCWGDDLNCDGILPRCGSCQQVLESGLSTGSGVYAIDRDGTGSGASIDLYCDMDSDGGGWTLAFVKNSAHFGSYGAFCAADVQLEALTEAPSEASLTLRAVAGWIDLNAFGFEVLRLASYERGERVFVSGNIPAEDLRIRFGEPGYLLYGGTGGYYWCGGDVSYTDQGVGQVSRPADAPADCKGHNDLGAGWDFSTSTGPDAGLTLSGAESTAPFQHGSYGASRYYYPDGGAAYALWVR